VSYYLNAWLKRSSVLQSTTFDPRFSVVFRATPADVIRLTAGQSNGIPDPSILFGPAQFNTTPTNITGRAIAPLLIGVGSASNPNLQPEVSKDLELAYGHRFKADSIIQLDFYESFEKNRIFGASASVLALGLQNNPVYLANLNAYCTQVALLYQGGLPAGTSCSAGFLGVSAQVNASSARFQGLEVTGRQRLNPHLYVDYSYDIQSGVYLGVPDSILQKNPTIINGSQINNLPLHSASASVDFASLKGFEIRFDNYYVGANNPYGRQSFFYTNALISQDVGKHTTLNVGVQNVFNQASSVVSANGLAPFVATNQFFPFSQNRQEGFGTTGLLPTQYTASVALHF
jgi:outer membrane receptor protein involved in Fe transport